MKTDTSAFAQRLREERTRRQMSQQDLGALIGQSRSSIYRFENEEMEPMLSTFIALADALDCSLDWLAGQVDG